MSVGLNTTGVPELDSLFEKLKQGQKRGVWLTTFRCASKPIVKAAKQNARSRHKKKTGNLVKSIGVRPVNRTAALRIGARTKQFKGQHGHLMDQGTTTTGRFTKKGKYTGRVKGSHFFTDAVEQNSSITEREIIELFRNSVVKMVERADKRSKRKAVKKK